MTVALEWGTLKARLRAAHRGELLGALRPPATADERLTIERTVGRPLGELAELLALSSGTDAPTDRPWDPDMLFPPQILLGVPEALAELENPDTVTVTGDYPLLGAVDNVFLCQTSSGEIVLCDPAEARRPLR